METQECILFIVAPDTVRRCQQYETHLTLHVSARHFFPILNKFGSSRQILVKVNYIKFHKNPSSGCRVDTNGQADRQKDGCTERTKVIGAFRH